MTTVECAKNDIGKKEKPGNTGFIDKDHENRMVAVGWKSGQAWCSYQVEAWFLQANPHRKAELENLFVPSAVNTFRNLVNAGYKHSMIPTVGALVYWQKMDNGKALWTGHAGVVSRVVSDTEFYSIEGNTNSKGSREGDSVQEKQRLVRAVKNGLQVLGFITL